MKRIEKAIAVVVFISAVLCLMSVATMTVEGKIVSGEVTLTYHEVIHTDLPVFNVQKFSNPEPAEAPLWNDAKQHTSEKHLCSSATERLTKNKGVFNGPSGKETWYSLDMTGVIRIMRGMGYDEEQYPYHVCEGCGCKMLGDYIIVAANLESRPRGTIVETSLGAAIVCDTGGFAKGNPTQLDVAVDW